MSGGAVFRGYDRGALDREYFLRGRVPDFQRYFDEYPARSAAVRSRLPCRLDQAYGPSEPERLDIFPAAGGPAPILVFIHGGYWQAFDAHDFDYVAEGLVPQGVATIVVNYALAPAVDLDEIVRQNRAALAWVWRNAGSFGGDRRRIVVAGHSAGGHLAAVMAATDWPAFAADLPPDLVQGALPISGIFDLEPIRLCYLNDKLGLDRAAAQRWSPVLHLPDQPVPLALCVGDLETDEFRRQQAEFVAAWAARSYPLEIVPAPGLHHFSVVNELGRAGSLLNQAALRLACGFGS